MYEIAWEEKEPAPPTARRAGRTAFILTDDVPAGKLLARELLEATGDEGVIHHHRSDSYCVSRLASAWAAASAVDVIMMNVAEEREATADALCHPVGSCAVHLRRGESSDADNEMRKGAQRVGGVSSATLAGVSGSALWGFGSAIRKEHSDLQCVRIDMDPAVPLIRRRGGGADRQSGAGFGRLSRVYPVCSLPRPAAEARRARGGWSGSESS